MDKNYYLEYYYLERNHWWFRVREQIIKDSLKKYLPTEKKTLKILNIGVATGRSTEMLSEFGDVTSIEYDKECCDFTSEKLNLNIINASITELPFNDNSFDLVCAFDVIEHVEDDKKGVEEMQRVCMDNGIVCITVPAFMQLWSHHDIVNHHFRRYILNEVVSLFKNNNNFLYKTYFNSLLFPPVFAFRAFGKLIPKKVNKNNVGSDFSVVNQDSFINKILYSIFNFERRLLKFITFPAGVSILVVWKK